MERARTVLVFATSILIAIGDLVLFLFALPFRIRRVLRRKKTKTIEVFNAHYLRQKIVRPKQRRRFLAPLREYLRTLFAKKEKKRLPLKKRLKLRRVVVYRFPLITKLRYFILGTFFSLLFVFTPLLIAIFLQELPNPRVISDGQIPQTTKIYDRNGTLLYQLYATHNRTVVPLSVIPKHLQLATVAIEDRKFYNHPGFDVVAIARSLWQNASGNGLQGGSTITQQLIKSTLLNPETSLRRKLKEVILAYWAERIYTKDQILAMYFNHIPYGGTAWGVEAASEVYFGKHVKDLTLAESAFLSGIPKAPTLYSPFGSNPTLWQTRQREVLDKMEQLLFISKEEKEQALEEELSFRTPQTPIYAPHFVMYVRDWLVRKYGLAFVEKGGLSVVTSLELKTQGMTQKAVFDEVEQNAQLGFTNGAVLVTNPKNGDILAMVGSKDFADENGGNVNVTTAPRQPGSAIKIVTYAAALSRGFTAATMLNDSPVSFPTAPGLPAYTPVNYDGRLYGTLPLRYAFGNSLNIPAVKTLSRIGIPTFVSLGKKMGIKSWGGADRYGLPITLGGAEVTMLDLATAYGVVANGGVRVDLNPTLRLTDGKGNVLEEKNTPLGEPVLDEGAAFILSDILADNKARERAFGPNSLLVIPGKTVSVKTGTSDNKRDNWTVGFTPSLVAVVWVGNLDGRPMNQALASGVTGAAPIWHRVMATLLNQKANERPHIPGNVVAKACLGRIEYFIRGTENSVNCTPPPPPPTPTPNP